MCTTTLGMSPKSSTQHRGWLSWLIHSPRADQSSSQSNSSCSEFLGRRVVVWVRRLRNLTTRRGQLDDGDRGVIPRRPTVSVAKSNWMITTGSSPSTQESWPGSTAITAGAV